MGRREPGLFAPPGPAKTFSRMSGGKGGNQVAPIPTLVHGPVFPAAPIGSQVHGPGGCAQNFRQIFRGDGVSHFYRFL